MPAIERIEKRDGDLGRQMRRALTTVPLNTGEAGGGSKGTRRARYESAQGSAREVAGCVEVAVALGYCKALDASVAGRLPHVIGTLRKLAA